MSDAGETTGSGAYGTSPSAGDLSVATVIPDRGGSTLGGAADAAVLRRLLPSGRSEGPGFNSSI
ncbi:hypothetical protein [Actinacidiphila bryophytorum]|uniref:Uncharacterized protein n=1 Tax=Actinacidiphila bryophytorum TaxID=1436133 RepID=A0A9W4E6I9_9ACTN|nr:hypothetical protein [Actinacidiphila bryophytorum]MBM9440076.1 hypothetical protein [Actinacidiphila bryophytorum]MBN6543942.1 hypothetical protein [Actinacidiphila bryophytorum]CAG7603048.1 hypothetical protein SBRY_10584 [Actinacidiphila bryophytorum]